MRNRRMGLPRHYDKRGRLIEIESEKPPRGDEATQERPDHEGLKYDRAVAHSHLGPVRLIEVTDQIFSALEKGQICRYGTTGWMLRCPECSDLIIMEEDTHKTYVSRDNSYFRLTPSLVCPNPKCTWHVFATVVPETVDEEEPVVEETAAAEEETTDDQVESFDDAGGQIIG